MKCESCQSAFVPSRQGQRFCCTACRMRAHRAKPKAPARLDAAVIAEFEAKRTEIRKQIELDLPKKHQAAARKALEATDAVWQEFMLASRNVTVKP